MFVFMQAALTEKEHKASVEKNRVLEEEIRELKKNLRLSQEQTKEKLRVKEIACHDLQNTLKTIRLQRPS